MAAEKSETFDDLIERRRKLVLNGDLMAFLLITKQEMNTSKYLSKRLSRDYDEVLHIIARLAIAPLIVLTFLAHKFWPICSSEYALEKFLLAEQNFILQDTLILMLLPLPDTLRSSWDEEDSAPCTKGSSPAAILMQWKLLAGSSKCNGDDFISEASTIGRIHHLNALPQQILLRRIQKSSHL